MQENDRFFLILSFLLTFILFTYVRLEKNITASMTFRIEIAHNELVSVEVMDSSATAILKGRAFELLRLAFKERRIRINIDEPPEHRLMRIPLREFLPVENVRIVKVKPETLNIFVEPIIERQREVKLNVDMDTSRLRIVEYTIEPRFVRLRGPESLVKGIYFVKTDRIHIDSSGFYRFKVVLEKPFTQAIIIPDSVSVEVSVEGISDTLSRGEGEKVR